MTGIVGAAIIEDYKSNSGITWRAVLLVLPTGYVFLIGLVWMFLITNFAKCVIGYAIGQLYFARLVGHLANHMVCRSSLCFQKEEKRYPSV